MPPPSRRANVALLLSLALIWGSSYMLIKLGLETLPPLTIAAARITLAALVAIIIVWFRGDRLPLGMAQWKPFFVMAMLSNVMPFILIAWGETRIDSGLTGILLGCMPLTTLVLAHLFTRDERLSRVKIIGLSLGGAGLAILVGPDALSGLGGHLLGELAVIGAALCYAAATVYAHRAIRARPTVSAAATLLVASAIILPASLILDTPWRLAPSALSLAAVALLGIIGTGVATLIYFRLISGAGATFTAMINYLIPPVSVIWGVMLLGETPTLQMAGALALILAGVGLINRKKAARDKPGTSAME